MRSIPDTESAALEEYLDALHQYRLWIAGCRTGEEARSLAILLAEEWLLDRYSLIASPSSAGGAS